MRIPGQLAGRNAEMGVRVIPCRSARPTARPSGTASSPMSPTASGRGPHLRSRLFRSADQAAEPRHADRGAAAGPVGERAAAGIAALCCSSTSTSSRSSTTARAITSATGSSARSPTGCGRRPLAPISSPGLGGDEFVVLLQNLGHDAGKAAEQGRSLRSGDRRRRSPGRSCSTACRSIPPRASASHSFKAIAARSMTCSSAPTSPCMRQRRPAALRCASSRPRCRQTSKRGSR